MHTRSPIPSAAALAGLVESACSGQRELARRPPADDRRTFSQLHADVVRDLLVHGTCGASTAEGGSVALGTTGRDAGGAGRDSDSSGRDSGRAHLPRLGEGVHAQVQAVVPVDLLIDEIAGHPVISSGATAELRGYGAIDPVTALELAASADGLGRILTDPATGQVLEVGRSVYRPPAALARFVRERDQTCRFPGCAVPAQNCEIDHTIDWQWGGPTGASNPACLCRRHHVMKHHSGWHVMHVNDDADLLWTSPTGAVHQNFAPCTGPIRHGPGFETPPDDIDVESLVDPDPPEPLESPDLLALLDSQ
ncbi:HNH endonuclease signature motif containing protein [Pseudoclavibacter sp. 13-3]|uniref:HNH endonuclease signature motif containing protein n=1 Tax=Pseudoclavibacter sp. 13-3 TaxID=2901228 RepID=UPI001E368A55|nr:HNH endonuclease signature motif containing protein [Pseudoclavibacter sp. 13-3]MCD7101714.1 HNH endonuclease [Pseudoclavibacter sp. 13-3]